MHPSKAPVSLADLHAAGIRVRADEAATLVRELIRQVVAGDIAGVPSAHVIRLSASGRLSVEGPVAAGEPSVVRAAQLLDALLQPEDGQGAARVPGGLKLVVARGLRTLDLPPFGSLAEFAQALERFAAGDAAAVVASLVERARAAQPAVDAAAEIGSGPTQGPAQVEPFAPVETPPVRAAAPPPGLTISDIRRARRAAGVSLAQVSEQSRIPIGLLRQLEWGYLLNWPAAPQGRHLLVRYARAAGLDDQLVVATVLPLVEQMASLRALFAARQAPEDRLAPAPPTVSALERSVAEIQPAVRQPRRSRAWRWVAAAALLVASLPAAWLALSLNVPGREPAAVHRPAEPEPSMSPASADHDAPPEHTAPEARPEASLQTDPAADMSGPIDMPSETPTSPPASAAERRVDATAAIRSSPPPAPRAATLNGSDAAAVGTAMFYQAGADEIATIGTSGPGAGSTTLRVTRIVDDAGNHSHVRPSPDNRFIAFDSDRHGERAVYVADADGRNVQRVSPEGFAAMPSWSPDGRSLAFVRAEPGQPDVWNLWTLERDTGELRQITRHTAGRIEGGSWLPTGDAIVYSLADRLIVHNLGTGSERVFASPRTGRPVRTPVASPDGRRVVFHVIRDGTWLLDLADGSMRRVLEDPTANAYAWSPDGTQLAYHSARAGGWGVWMMGPRN